MKVARISFLGVLLLVMFLSLKTLAASPVSAATITEQVVNANGGVYWRSEPDWSTPIKVTRQGVYTGDTVELECYQRGSTVPPYYNNPLWYWARIVSGYGQGSGWVNDHFLNTGTNQPNIPVAGIPICGYVSSSSGAAHVRAQPDVNSALYATAPNGYRLTIYCWVDGGWADGNYWTNRWFQVAVPYWQYGGVGYIHASLVAPQPTLPHC